MPSRDGADVYVNRVATAVPPFDVHHKFLDYVLRTMTDERDKRLFQRLASKAEIERRYSVLEPSPDPELLDTEGFYRRGSFPGTERRMRKYQESALALAAEPVARILNGTDAGAVTHLIVTTCTGFYAPGLDLELQRRFGLRGDLERSVIGFMGCFAGITGLRQAYHIVRSRPEARVLVVNLELCTLHLQEDRDLEQVMGFLQFADGCAVSLVSGEATGARLTGFGSAVFADGGDLIQWGVGDQGFRMKLAMTVPQILRRALPGALERLGENGAGPRLWAVHPGGRAILDAVESGLGLGPEAMGPSRRVLRDYGNMSSPTVLFVLKDILEDPAAIGTGLALAFGPGLSLEAAWFEKTGG